MHSSTHEEEQIILWFSELYQRIWGGPRKYLSYYSEWKEKYIKEGSNLLGKVPLGIGPYWMRPSPVNLQDTGAIYINREKEKQSQTNLIKGKMGR